MTFFSELVDDSDKESEADERARRQDEEQDVGRFGQDAETEHGAASKEFADAAQNGQGEGEAQAHACTVENGRENWVFRGEGLSTTEHDAVHHDKRNKQAEGFVNVGNVGLHHQLDDGHKRGYDHDEAGDTNLVGDEALQQRNYQVRHDEDEGGGQAHRHAVDGAGGGGQGRAAAQQQHQNRVLLDEAFGKGLQIVSHCCPPFMNFDLFASKLSQAIFTAPVKARELIVAAVMASTSPPSFLTLRL